ncbi:cyanophycin synthetase [Denitromonas iodatirespirans]|uniref:Cyanophycin synthetase n=1 Tax=Denitromonas iodatirespirans TaxID=2795389 RepID=A0A944D5Q8_DENI1|nr:cyanophycin synthetase [Denitromonas iodatirespirans]MBT0960465.1 cyanophycin synthetase [Denitromonas iodatirespirans]
MEITRLRALRGPNLWSRLTSFEALVHCTDTELALADLPGFEARLRERFPTIGAMRPVGHQGDITLAHVLGFATLGLQAEAGCPVSFVRCNATVDRGVFQVVVEYTEEAVGRMAVDFAEQLIAAALADAPFDLAAIVQQLHELDADIRLGPSTASIVHAAVARGIPYRRLTDGSLVQFGWGSKQRRIQAAEIDSTSAIAESIAQDKDLTKQLLRAAGVPTPDGRPVTDAEDAWAAMCEIGDAVVVKPQDGNQGKGVTVNILTRDHLEVAYHAAHDYSDEVMVERFSPGHDFRLLVVGNTLVAAARREPPHVIGDGEHTVRQLVDIVNADPRRGEGHATSLTKIRFDEIAVARLKLQGFTPEDVPPKGARVVLRNNANLSTGGTATDVTDDVHPEVAARAIEAAQMIGLDICGVDVVCETVGQPLEAQGGSIVEVNAAPGLRMHLSPSYGKGRDVGQAVVDMLYTNGDNGRIPVVAVTGTNGKTTTVRLMAHLLTQAGYRTGFTGTEGVHVNGRCTDTGDCSGPKSARNVLSHPEVDAAVLECARGGMLREGLGFDMCDVAIVTNIGVGDHLGLNYINSVEDLSVLKRVVVQNVAPTGTAVLNACDPHTVAMAVHCPGKVVFFASQADAPAAALHRALGRRVVVREGDDLCAVEGEVIHRIPLARVPLTLGGAIAFQVENVMAVMAAAWSLDIDWAVIDRALETFESTTASAPGRFNLFRHRGATVIADYGHNPDAISALVRAVEAMPGKRRSVVISGAGDRRDEDITAQTRQLGDAFDDVILYEDACQRGRADGEVLRLLREGLADARRTARVDEIYGEFLAIDTALDRLDEGDLCLILIDQVDAALAHIGQRVVAR